MRVGRVDSYSNLAYHKRSMVFIRNIRAREILDSRGNPTVEATVYLSDKSWGRGAAPSGASTGSHEALELRDGESRFGGKGVLRAVSNIIHKIAPILVGQSPFLQEEIDQLLIKLDGTSDKSNLGGNTILAVSIAIAHAAASSKGLPLYRYMSEHTDMLLPVPMFNILNGGSHAHKSVDFQEFMVVPAGVSTFAEAVRAGTEIYQALKTILSEKGLSTNVGDEGGFAPTLRSNQQAMDLIVASIEKAGYKLGKECSIALDLAASEFYSNGIYKLDHEGIDLDCSGLMFYLESRLNEYPIVSIEDPLAEDDWICWKEMTSRLGKKVQIVGDDLFTTNTIRIEKGIKSQAANAVLIKPNQIGTLTETLTAIQMARNAGWGTIMSHRSGETEDTTIADLAVAWNTGQIKAGAPCRSERTAKYNRLLEIANELGEQARYAGFETFTHNF